MKTRKRRKPKGDKPEQEVQFYKLNSKLPVLIEPAPPTRPWMGEFQNGNANSCMPLRMGCAQGWQLLCPFTFCVVWDGGRRPEDIWVFADERDEAAMKYMIASQFGWGMLTISQGFLIRTPPGVEMLLTGPTNYWRDGLAHMTAMLETSHMVDYFAVTMKLTRPGQQVWFHAGTPYAQLLPIHTGRTKALHPVLRSMKKCPWRREHKAQVKARADFMQRKYVNPPPADAPKSAHHQLDYMRNAHHKFNEARPVNIEDPEQEEALARWSEEKAKRDAESAAMGLGWVPKMERYRMTDREAMKQATARAAAREEKPGRASV